MFHKAALSVRCIPIAVSILSAVSLAYADDRANKALEIDSWGRPEGIGTSERPQYFVWQDEQGWHVHTDTGGKLQKFTILIETVGGRVLKFTNLSGLEGKKFKNSQDRGVLSADKRTIRATFFTSVKTDAIDFTVDNNTSLIRFRLLINGEERPRAITIGAQKSSPPAAVFGLAKKNSRK
jgi:hypothetical protein